MAASDQWGTLEMLLEHARTVCFCVKSKAEIARS